MIKSQQMKEFVFNNVSPLDLAATLDCGQSFRWVPVGNGATFCAVVEGGIATARMEDGALRIACKNLSEDFWRGYFALDVDYSALHSEFRKDATLAACLEFAPGIRVLRQPFFETLISFIISQNNNIPRIKGIIGRLCENFGEQVGTLPDGSAAYAFPLAERLATLSVEDLACLRSGYRAPAIIDAAKRTASGELNDAELRTAEPLIARKKLLAVYGVGPKIADCVLLFGLGRFETFPVDVWIRRAMASLFPNGLPEAAVPCAGIAQQYIFHYARMTGLD